MNGRYYVGEWLVQPEQHRLVRGSETAKLDPKAVQVLSLLADHPNEVLTKERIFASVWEGAFVSDEVLTTAIWGLRRALGDDAKEPRYIQTVPRRGYRLIAPVERLTGASADRWEPSPYPGLSAFSQRDAQYFFGREAEVEVLWTRIHERNLLGLIGPSGAGKSSLLRAGLIPSAPEGWDIVLYQPRAEALERLSVALEGSDGQTATALWVVDQFEELFTLHGEETQRRFAELIGRAAESGIHVLLSMRDDFLIRCHAHPPLEPVFEKLTPVLPLEGAALRRALVEPARALGYQFEDEALVAEILTEVSGERGALPLLAFSASKLWERRDRETRRLTREAFLAIGGVAGALAHHAETTLSSIGAGQQPIVREILRNLTTASGTRLPMNREELLTVFVDREAASEVLGKLIDARLLTSSESEVELIHESLLTAWPRLVRWQTQDADGAQLRDQLRQAAQYWESKHRSEDLLWTGTAFKEFQVWRAQYPGGLTWIEEEFERAMTAKERRQVRRKRVSVASILLALALGLAVTLGLWRQSETERRRAEASKLVALGQLELEEDATRALAHALKSLELSDEREARVLALKAVQRGVARILTVESGEGHRVDFSPTGDSLAIGGYTQAQLLGSGQDAPRILGKFTHHKFSATWPRFGPHGDVLVGFKRGDLRVWSLPSGDEVKAARVAEESEDIRYIFDQPNLFFFENGFFTVTVDAEEVVIHRWSFEGQVVLVGRMPRGVGAIGIDPAGTRVAYARREEVLVRSLEDWSLPPRRVGAHEERVTALAFHPAGEWLAAIDPAEVRFWSLETTSPEPMRVLPSNRLQGLEFAPSGRKLVSYGYPDGEPIAHLWDLGAPSAAEPTLLTMKTNFFNDAAFTPNRRWLATTHAGSVALWPLAEVYPWVLTGHEEWVTDIAFTSDGDEIVSVSQDGRILAWPLAAGGEERMLRRAPAVFPRLAVDPDGERALVGTPNEVLLINLEDGEARVLEGFSEGAFTGPLAWHPEGERFAAAPAMGPASDHIIRIWDSSSGRVSELGPPARPSGSTDRTDSVGGSAFDGLAFTPNGKLVSYGSGVLRVWNLEDGTSRILAQAEGGDLATSKDGRFGIYSVPETTLHRIDLTTGETTIVSGRSGWPVALDPSGTMLVSGRDDGVVEVGPATGGEPHLLFGHDGLVRSVAVSPDSRWVASAGDDRTIRVWPMPDGRPFHELPYDELLERLRALTNLRAVESEDSPTGYELELAPFPDWKNVPVW